MVHPWFLNWFKIMKYKPMQRSTAFTPLYILTWNEISDIRETIHIWNSCTQTNKLTCILIWSRRAIGFLDCIVAILQFGHHFKLCSNFSVAPSLFWRVILQDHLLRKSLLEKMAACPGIRPVCIADIFVPVQGSVSNYK